MRTANRYALILLACTCLAGCTAGRVQAAPFRSSIQGTVAPGFEEVRYEFSRNFASRSELGAACVVYHRGKKVVDLWGGVRDAKQELPWEEHTQVLVFSVTKGLAAMTLAVAHSKGYLDYDEPVATYWPEFAQNGKGEITVRQLLAHQAGLILLDEPVSLSEIQDQERFSSILAQQEPVWEPGMRLGYHASTLGFYMNEIIRRVDPLHRSLGQFFREEIAIPLELECHIGLPAGKPDSLVATVHMLSGVRMLAQLPPRTVLGLLAPRSRVSRVIRIPRDFKPNERASRQAELPSVNAIGEVRSIAKVYSILANGGQELNLADATYKELTASAPTPLEGHFDLIRGVDSYFSLGFEKPGPEVLFGSSQAAFGSAGFGGAFAFADPSMNVGYAFASMKMGYCMKQDPRENALREATYRAIHQLENFEAMEMFIMVMMMMPENSLFNCEEFIS